MVLSLSAVVLLAALTFLLLRFAGLRAWRAAVCILLGFFLASSSLGPYIRDATQAAQAEAGADQHPRKGPVALPRPAPARQMARHLARHDRRDFRCVRQASVKLALTRRSRRTERPPAPHRRR